MYIFKYHPDNVIYRNGTYVSTFAEFKELNPDFPIVEGQFFEYSSNGFVAINEEGHNIEAAPDVTLIEAINNLE